MSDTEQKRLILDGTKDDQFQYLQCKVGLAYIFWNAYTQRKCLYILRKLKHRSKSQNETEKQKPKLSHTK